MLRRDRQIRMQIHQLMDACLFAASFWLTYEVRANQSVIDFFGLDPVASFDSFVWTYLFLIPAAPLVLESQGFYNRSMLCPWRAMVWSLFKSCLIITLGLVMILVFVRLYLPRSVIIWFGLVAFVLIYIKQQLLRVFLRSSLARAQYVRRFILVGTGEEIEYMRVELRSRPDEEMEVVAELDLNEVPVQKLAGLLHEHSVNGVILSAKHAFFEQIEAAIRTCEIEGVEAWLVADFFKTQISRTSLDDFHGHPVVVFSATPETSWQSVLKYAIDFFGTLVLLILFAIPMFLVAVLIKLTSPGPILFRQQRAGLNGQPFTIYKFRTMVTNAEQLKHELERLNEMTGPVFKVSKDPRITPIGRLLRKFSIDEFPQLFNVLRGEMSLVGPRPLPVDEVKRFDDMAHRRRLSVKPGLTCLWQISGRNNVSDFRDWVRLDLEYIDNWSLWLDLKILLRTVPIVLTGIGSQVT